ncbi:hypothetical protein CRYUN_Cryun23aG0101600 [Craigia yunnanensis]
MILLYLDKNVSSDDDDDDDDDFDVGGNKGTRNEDVDGSDGVEDADDERNLRMLQGITGMSSDSFEGKKRKNNVVISEAHLESEYNPTRDVLKGDGHITVQDLLDPIQGKPGYRKFRKRVQQMDRKSTSIQAPLPKADREKLERMTVYKHSKKDITKWEHLVKRNIEAPTIFLGEDVDLGFSTVGAIASEFEPRTEFEKNIASLVYDDKVMEAHKADASKLLELNKDGSQNFDDIVRDPGRKTTFEVAIFALDSWRRMKSGNGVDTNVKKSQEVKEPIVHNQDLEEGEEESDSDSGGQMVGGILSSGPLYELPS